MDLLSPIVSAIDTHTGGEPARIVLGGLPPILGDDMAAKKAYFTANLDHWRTLLMQEPRGHKDMFGVILTTPTTAESNYGALFIDSTGAIDMCGHGLMALATALIEVGMVKANAPETILRFNTPAGLVETRAHVQGERVSSVTVKNVPSFVAIRDFGVRLPDLGMVVVDVVFAGNFFAMVPGSALGVQVTTGNISRLVSLGMAVKEAVNTSLHISHPEWAHINQVELTKIYDTPDSMKSTTRSVVIFGKGQLDRSPCGTGTAAMMTLAHAKGELALGEEHISENLLGSCFRGHLLRELQIGDRRAVLPIVSGEAYLTGIPQFLLDPRDPLANGFLLDSCVRITDQQQQKT